MIPGNSYGNFDEFLSYSVAPTDVNASFEVDLPALMHNGTPASIMGRLTVTTGNATRSLRTSDRGTVLHVAGAGRVVVSHRITANGAPTSHPYPIDEENDLSWTTAENVTINPLQPAAVYSLAVSSDGGGTNVTVKINYYHTQNLTDPGHVHNCNDTAAFSGVRRFDGSWEPVNWTGGPRYPPCID